MREVVVTCALPYANGPAHLGHLVEHIQADIWVRAQRMNGLRVYFVCADDAHGTPIMLRAEQMGTTPKALTDAILAEHRAAFAGFHIGHDHYSSTDSPTNRELTEAIYYALKRGGHLAERPIEQLYDAEKGLFLPDRYVKGGCPRCGAEDQYGDSCEVCGATYAPTELIEPRSVLSGSRPELRRSTHLFVKLAEFESMLRTWIAERQQAGALQAEVVNKLAEWFDQGLKDWDVSRDAPYYGFEIPDLPGKYFYVWLDAPIGYLASLKELCERGAAGLTPPDFARLTRADAPPDTALVHFIGKDIVYFHTLFWPAMLHAAGLRKPDAVFVHGFLTVDGEKMSKSRGTFINAATYLRHLDPDDLRYYLATLLGSGVADLDLDLKAFEERVNSHLVGKFVNIASRTAGFIERRFGGRLAEGLSDASGARYRAWAERLSQTCAGPAGAYAQREYARAMRAVMEIADEINAAIAERAPWQLAKRADASAELHDVCTLAINGFRLLCGYLKPVIPATIARAEEFLGECLATFDQVQEPRLDAAIATFQALRQRIDPKAIHAMIEDSKPGAPAPASATPAPAGTATAAEPATIGIDEFARIDLRIARIVEAEAVPQADKLLRLVLDLGPLGRRQVYAGIKAAYAPADLVGRLTVMVANLAPRKMRFGLSEGMVLAASDERGGPFLLAPDHGAEPGMRVK